MENFISHVEENGLILMEDIVNKRKSQFKCSGWTEETSRDKRRSQLLEDYKRKRDLLLNEKRGLIEDEFSEDEDWMDWEDTRSPRYRKNRENCKDQLMLSEWLLDRPFDIETAWSIVVCPKGQRTLVVANRGCTRAYHKTGRLIAKVRSILPFGSPLSKGRNKDIIILDCIWQAKTKQLFALDVLFWKNQPLLSCDAEFRLYWLRSKILELRKYDMPKTQGVGVYDVHLPPHCCLSSLPAVLANYRPSEVDGILFYHNGAPYISGQTPLVGWLKPYMLPERFGLEVPQEFLDQTPPEYQYLEQWVDIVSHSHTNMRKKSSQQRKEKMDCTVTSSNESESSVCEMSEVLELSDVDTTKHKLSNSQDS